MRPEINKIIRIYDEEKSSYDEIIFDIYEIILAKLDSKSLVKET